MSIADLVFIAIAAVTIYASLGVVTSKNIFHSALFLIISFLGVAAIYFQLNAAFLGLVQIMVYAGAISVLIIFAIMLVMTPDISTSNPSDKKGTAIGIIIAGLFTSLVAASVISSKWNLVNNVIENPVEMIAELLMGDFVIAFEVAAILLLVAAIGAIIIAKGADDKR